MGFEIPIDSAYSGHPKTLRLIALTGKPEADTYPIRLWMWAAEYARDGVVEGGPPQVELACRWRGTPGKLAQALVEAGFMEVDGKTIHDWMEHVGRAIAIYEEKKRIQREKYAVSRGINPEFFRKNSTYPSNPSNPSNPSGDVSDETRRNGADAPSPVSAAPEAGPSAAAPGGAGDLGGAKAPTKRVANPILDPLRKAAAAASVFSYNKRQLDTVLTSWVARDGQSGVLAKLQDPTSKGRDVLILFKEPKPANGTVPFKAFVAPPRPCGLCDGTGKVADLAKSTATKTMLKPCGSCGGKGLAAS